MMHLFAWSIPNVDPNDLLQKGLNFTFITLGIVCVIIIIYAGFQFILAAGDSGKIKTAKNTILYAAVGLIVATLAFAITNFIIGALQ